ncbi:MAG: nickel pincer cofactor biosynthesis protein LarB [Deltaproteobacteria bacterium]|nr:nickel pincer cofactor biosynthesis protein LarB [Deltaproteobacteria bacterium]
MKEQDIEKILQSVAEGAMTAASALERLKTLPFEDLGYAAVDHHRTIRQGFPEVIYGEGKTASQIIGIIGNMLPRKHPILATRIDADKAKQIRKRFPKAKYYPDSRVLTLISGKIPLQGKGLILVISAGTSDIPVAEEAFLTAQIMGNRVEYLYDVGVAGIHRLMSRTDKIREANVIIVVAGMEGALPSVVGGLVSRPVIAVPTSIGYGASFGGIAALLGMLNTCAAGVTVVNIDNGFGAGYFASLINREA